LIVFFIYQKAVAVPLHRLVYHNKYNIALHGAALGQTLEQILSSAIRSNSERGLSAGD
jgi:hypothetical protein